MEKNKKNEKKQKKQVIDFDKIDITTATDDEASIEIHMYLMFL